MLESAKVHDKYKNVLVVTGEDLSIRHYLMKDGLFQPGYTLITYTPDIEYLVHLFVPIEPGARPDVLLVEPRQNAA